MSVQFPGGGGLEAVMDHGQVGSAPEHEAGEGDEMQALQPTYSS